MRRIIVSVQFGSCDVNDALASSSRRYELSWRKSVTVRVNLEQFYQYFLIYQILYTLLATQLKSWLAFSIILLDFHEDQQCRKN